MAKFFLFGSKKRVPTSLEECYEVDDVTQKLLDWVEWLKIWGVRVLVILLIIGVFSTIEDGLLMAEVDDEMVLSTVVSSAIAWAFYAFIEYCTYNAIALLILALAKIVQNTKITASVSLYNASKNECQEDRVQEECIIEEPKQVVEKREVSHSWRCDNCGKMRTQSPCPYCGK